MHEGPSVFTVSDKEYIQTLEDAIKRLEEAVKELMYERASAAQEDEEPDAPKPRRKPNG